MNVIGHDSKLKCIVTLLFPIEKNGSLSEGELVKALRTWPEAAVSSGIAYLYDTGVIGKYIERYNIK